MGLTLREANKVAIETASEAGYSNAKVTGNVYDEDEESYIISLKFNGVEITVEIDEDGDVIDFVTEGK